MAGAQGCLAAGLPARAEFLTVIGEGPKQKQGETEDDGGDEEKSEKGEGVAQDELAAGQPFFRGQDDACVGGRHPHLSSQIWAGVRASGAEVCKFPMGAFSGVG